MRLLSVVVSAAAAAAAAEPRQCEGEFQRCQSSGECSLVGCDSPNACGSNEYRCPISDRCVAGAAAYSQCPGLSGTHLDPSMPLDFRVEYCD